MVKPRSLMKGFERAVQDAKPNGKKQVLFDPESRGLALIVTAKGKRTFSVVARDPSNRQVWKQLGNADQVTLARAREMAAEAVARVKAGQTPIEPPAAPEAAPETFRQVAERFVQRWVNKGGKKQDGVPLRTKREIERHLKTYVYPRWESKPFLAMRRGAVTQLMDEMVDNHGAVQADRVLSTLAKLFNWYRQYDEAYVSPIIPEMKRSGSHVGRARVRILADDEIRVLWGACAEVGTFGAFLRVALLTGQRRAKVATMRWDEVQDGVWTIAVEPREKVNAGELKLPQMALDVIEGQPKIEGNPFVFAGRGKKAINSFSDGKELVNAKMKIPPWTIHDLRRTARSLMARAGVRSDIAERTLGHVIAGVERVYDRHAYREEKGGALEALASLVERILNGDHGNVVPMRKAKAK